MAVLVVQHDDLNGPGRIGAFLDRQGIEFQVVRPDRGEDLPRPQEYQALVLLGGQMRPDDDDHPWLAAEEQFLRRARRRGVSVLGINFGALLLARAAGALVRPLRQRELGAGFIELNEAGRRDVLFSELPEGLTPRFPVLQWTEDAFELPPGGRNLASSFSGTHQVLKLEPNLYGLQFHVEVPIESVEARVAHYGQSLVTHPNKFKVAGAYQMQLSAVARPFEAVEIADGVAAVEPHIQIVCERLLQNYFGKIVQLPVRADDAQTAPAAP